MGGGGGGRGEAAPVEEEEEEEIMFVLEWHQWSLNCCKSNQDKVNSGVEK